MRRLRGSEAMRRLVRETRGSTIVLSLPVADAKAQGSHDTLPIQERPDQLPHER